MAATSVLPGFPIPVCNKVEDVIRTRCQTKRIRISEYFLDYDKLRSGYVTRTQFFRTLWQNLGIKLTPDEEKAVEDKYDLNRNGRLNYRKFCDIIEKAFNPFDLNADPQTQKVEPREFLGTERSVRPLTSDSETMILDLLRRMEKFYQYHGINLRTCYEDFDRHHVGVVTESQFYRNFPGPPDVNPNDMRLLVDKYRDPERPGLLNYLNLHHDIIALYKKDTSPDINFSQKVDLASYLPQEAGADQSLQNTFDKIRVAVYKSGVRTTEFFKDHDKLRSGIITENQFNCGLSLAIGKEAQLTRGEIQKVVEFYRQSDGRVRYKEFCDGMENAFTVANLEKMPTMDVSRPPRGALGRTINNELSDVEENRIRVILMAIAETVRKRRLMMFQYFKDYDRGKGHTRIVTKSQFGRILHFLSLNVSSEDLKLLARKFAGPSPMDVNYPAFVQAVDNEFVGYTVDPVASETSEEDITASQNSTENTATEVDLSTVDTSGVNLDDLLARVRHICLANRLRVLEYFEDFDPLRSGSISKTQFRRGLASLGLSKLGQHDLTTAQFAALCNHYQNPEKQDQVFWKKFLWDIESVFTQPNLEKNPTHSVPAQEIFRVPKPGTMDWRNASDDHKQFVDGIMGRLQERAEQRRVLAKPVFQDFDRHNNGYVTRTQFKQCLTMLELNCTEAEMAALEAKFCNDTGFDYIKFLKELQPEEQPKMMYMERLKTIRLANETNKLPEQNSCTDLEGVLIKIKCKVFKERVRVLDFMTDYDKLNSGRMIKTSFRRALDLCKFELTESEAALLEDRYQSPMHPDFVNYRAFSDEIESVFTTKDLEKQPLTDVHQFQPPVEWENINIGEEEEELLALCMKRLAEKVRKRRMQLFPLFEDYDKVHNGTVSRTQFTRVLSELELGSLVSNQEFSVLYQKFDQMVGGKDDVNYIAFCDMINTLAKFEWRKP